MGEFRSKGFLFCLVLFLSFWTRVSFAKSVSEALLLYEKGRLEFVGGRYNEALEFFKGAYAVIPENQQNLHLLGLTYLKLEKFSQAEKYLQELFSKNPDYAPAYFDYGLSLFRQNKFDSALPWFEKEGDQKENPFPLFYAGLSHYYLGETAMALELFKKVGSLFPGTETAESAQEWMAKIETPEGEKPEPYKVAKRWGLRGSTGVFFDSNVVRDPDDENLTGFTNIADVASTGSLDAKYLLVPKDKTKLTIAYSGYQSAYLNLRFDSNDFNYGRHRGGFDVVHRINDTLQLRIPIYYTFATLGNAKFVQTGEGEVTLDMIWSKNALASITGGGQRDFFFDTPANAAQNRDANKAYAKFEQFFFSPNNRDFYVKAGYGFEKNMASGADWDYDSHHLYAAIQTPFFWKTKFLILSEFVPQRRFFNVDSNFNAIRSDKSETITSLLSKELSRFLTASASYTFSLQDSRLIRFTYTRHVTGLTLAAKW